MSSPLTAEWTAALGSFYGPLRVAPKILMSCSSEKTLLVSDLRSTEWTMLWEREMCGFPCGPSSSGSRVQPRGKGKQGSRLEIPRECLHSSLEACAREKQGHT